MNSNINMKKIYSGLVLFLFIFIFIALSAGDINIPLKDTVGSLLNKSYVDDSTKNIVLNIRLPRIIMSVLIGMLLASSGTVVQTVFRNPLYNRNLGECYIRCDNSFYTGASRYNVRNIGIYHFRNSNTDNIQIIQKKKRNGYNFAVNNRNCNILFFRGLYFVQYVSYRTGLV